jgi:hypothetical protein
VVWLVNILVDRRMVQGAMYPIDAVVGEDQETMIPMSEKIHEEMGQCASQWY